MFWSVKAPRSLRVEFKSKLFANLRSMFVGALSTLTGAAVTPPSSIFLPNPPSDQLGSSGATRTDHSQLAPLLAGTRAAAATATILLLVLAMVPKVRRRAVAKSLIVHYITATSSVACFTVHAILHGVPLVAPALRGG